MIRVLRLIEYTYPDSESAEADMSNWYMTAIGTKRISPNRVIRSTILTDLNYEGDVDGNDRLDH